MVDSGASAALPSPLVETAWLEAQLDDPALRVFDCSVIMEITDEGGYTFRSGEAEWLDGHILGSVFVDVLGKLGDRRQRLPLMMPPAEEFAATMAGFGAGRGTRVVLYDRSEHSWAARVWWMLRACGFDAAAVLNGGWQKWVAEQRPVSTEPGAYPEGDFTPTVRPELFATKREVQASLESERVCLINALSPADHSGASGNRPRRGRIPGSANVFCQSLVDPDSHAYHPEPELRQIFAATPAMSADRLITYCGAGIAASNDALALTLLGVENVAVYDGSLAEWAADPDLPLEVD